MYLATDPHLKTCCSRDPPEAEVWVTKVCFEKYIFKDFSKFHDFSKVLMIFQKKSWFKKKITNVTIFQKVHDFSKIADLQARNSALGAALWACRFFNPSWGPMFLLPPFPLISLLFWLIIPVQSVLSAVHVGRMRQRVHPTVHGLFKKWWCNVGVFLSFERVSSTPPAAILSAVLYSN